MAIPGQPDTAQVRGPLRDPAPAGQAAAYAGGEGARQGTGVLFNRGIPGADAWRR